MKQSRSTRPRGHPRAAASDTQLLRLLAVLNDGEWHSTKELVRRVGHCFGVAKYKLLLYGYEIERRRHPVHHTQHQYRLVDSTENNG